MTKLKDKFASPRLRLTIDEERWQTARDSDSGACLIADVIRDSYAVPLRMDDVDVNVATIQIRDRAAGVKYTYLTPADAQQIVLAFDQGWPQPTQRFTLTRAVKITPIRGTTPEQKQARTARRAARFAELEAKELAAPEELTHGERISLSRMRNENAKPEPAPERPTNWAAAEVEEVAGTPVVYGGRSLKQNPSNLNLLGGRRRIFGAKLADPGKAFRAAVDKAVEERERERREGAADE